MNREELNSFIEKVDTQNSIDEAYIGFFYDEHHNEYSCYIKANKEGVMLYANQLLKASLEFDSKALNNETVFEISYDTDLKFSEFEFSHIEYVNKPKSELEEPKQHKQTFKNQVGCFIGIVIGIFALTCLLVGVYTICTSIF